MKDKHKKAYMKCAEAFAECSVGERLKVGSVIVKNNRIISCGYNALPEHIDGPLEDENGVTKREVRHAEKNALMGLIRSNESAVGATMFVTHSCCKYCAIDIVDAGIQQVIYRHEYRDLTGIHYLIDNGVHVEQIKREQENIKDMDKEEQPTHIVKYFENGYWYGGRVWYKRYKSKEEALEAIEQHNKTTKNKGGYNDYYITASYEGVDTSNNPKYDKIHHILEKKIRWTDIHNPQLKMKGYG